LPAERSAELTPQCVRNQPAAGIDRHRLREWITRLGEVIPTEQKSGPMIVVGPGLSRSTHHARLRLPELGVEIRTGYFGLNNRVEVRHDDHVAVQKIPVIGTVQAIADPGEVLSVDVDGNAALRILGRSVVPIEL